MKSISVEGTFKVGDHTVCLTINNSKMTTEWSPDLPRSITQREVQQYRIGRDAVLAEYAAPTGMKIALIEI